MIGSTVTCLVACDSPSGRGDPDPPGDLGGGGSGDGTSEGSSASGPLIVLPARIQLGEIDCGSSASAGFEITNRTTAALTFTLTTSDSHVVVSREAVTVAPGAAVPIEVTAAVPAAIDAATRLDGSLFVITSAGTWSQLIPVEYRSHGVEIRFDHTTITFGDTEAGTVGGHGFRVINTGSVPATITIAEPGGEFGRRFGDSGTVTLDPEQAATGEFSYLPVDVGTDTASAGVTVTGPGPDCGRKLDHVTLVATAIPHGGR